jgi:hypothetical protein
MTKDANATETVRLLTEAAKTDSIHRDIYLRRARELLSATLDESGYHAIGSAHKDIDELVRRTRSAVLQHKWEEATKLSAQADQLRQRIAAMGNLSSIAKDVYEADTVAFDPFSPGKHLGPQSQANQPALRAQVLDTLTSLGKLDTRLGSFYEKRRGYFSGLEVASAARRKRVHSATARNSNSSRSKRPNAATSPRYKPSRKNCRITKETTTAFLLALLQ